MRFSKVHYSHRSRPAAVALAAAFGMIATQPVRADDAPYDVMQRSYGVHLNAADPLAWPAKVRAIAKDEYHFWRGTRDLFYAWAGRHCRDWLTDRRAATVSHGDLHLGNLGTFAAAGGFGRLGYGVVDFDDSATLPVQLELLQGVVTFELIAAANDIALSPDTRQRLRDDLFDAYADALLRPPPADELAKLVKSRADRPYADDLERFTHGGRFKSAVIKKGVVTDVLRPVDRRDYAAIARGLADAVRHDARLAKLLKPYDASEFEAAILDVAERTRIESSGSQGLAKILVLLKTPFRPTVGTKNGMADSSAKDVANDTAGGDGLIYLKQQLPAAAERANIVPPVPGSPGRRYVRDMDRLTHCQSLASSWCDLGGPRFGGRAFWVSVKEPWSDEPDSAKIKTAAELRTAAQVWARVAADSHRADAARLRPLLTPSCRQAVFERADAYLAWQATAFADFIADPRTTKAVAQANEAAAAVR